MTEAEAKPPIPLGTKVGRYGTVEAVGWVGERYYWLTDKRGDVAMLPASMIEPMYQAERP